MTERRPYAWAVEYGKGLVALFLDRARAEHAAVTLHGVLVALVRQDAVGQKLTD